MDFINVCEEFRHSCINPTLKVIQEVESILPVIYTKRRYPQKKEFRLLGFAYHLHYSMKAANLIEDALEKNTACETIQKTMDKYILLLKEAFSVWNSGMESRFHEYYHTLNFTYLRSEKDELQTYANIYSNTEHILLFNNIIRDYERIYNILYLPLPFISSNILSEIRYNLGDNVLVEETFEAEIYSIVTNQIAEQTRICQCVYNGFSSLAPTFYSRTPIYNVYNSVVKPILVSIDNIEAYINRNDFVKEEIVTLQDVIYQYFKSNELTDNQIKKFENDVARLAVMLNTQAPTFQKYVNKEPTPLLEGDVGKYRADIYFHNERTPGPMEYPINLYAHYLKSEYESKCRPDLTPEELGLIPIERDQMHAEDEYIKRPIEVLEYWMSNCLYETVEDTLLDSFYADITRIVKFTEFKDSSTEINLDILFPTESKEYHIYKLFEIIKPLSLLFVR